MLLKEAFIIGTIGIIIGIIIGSIISFILIIYLGEISQDYFLQDVVGMKILINPDVKFHMIFPLKQLILTIIIGYITTIISCVFPIRKINKISQIEAIRGNKNQDIKEKEMKVSKIITKLFKQEGELAYKNIKRDKSRYKTIVISIVLNIVLVLTVSRLLYLNLLPNNTKINTTVLSINNETQDIKICMERSNKVINYLQEKELIDDYLIENQIYMQAIIPKDKVTDKGITLYNNKVITLNEDKQNYKCNLIAVVESGPEFRGVLQKLGIEELNKNECIILNTIFGTKYGKAINVTDYNIGDIVHVKEPYYEELTPLTGEELEKVQETMNININNYLLDFEDTVEEKEIKDNLSSQEFDIKIAGIIEEKTKWSQKAYSYCPLIMIINEETAKEFCKNDNISLDSTTLIKISMQDSKEIKNAINDIKDELGIEVDMTFFEGTSSLVTLAKIENTLVYSFLILISLLCALNIFNVISSGIKLRKQEISMLKSMGMSDKQINKMLILEGIFYGLDAIIYGMLIQLLIYYIIYIVKVQTNIYAFEIPWKSIFICITYVYFTIFIAIWKGKRKMKDLNIIEEIRKENI